MSIALNYLPGALASGIGWSEYNTVGLRCCLRVDQDLSEITFAMPQRTPAGPNDTAEFPQRFDTCITPASGQVRWSRTPLPFAL